MKLGKNRNIVIVNVKIGRLSSKKSSLKGPGLCYFIGEIKCPIEIIFLMNIKKGITTP